GADSGRLPCHAAGSPADRRRRQRDERTGVVCAPDPTLRPRAVLAGMGNDRAAADVKLGETDARIFAGDPMGYPLLASLGATVVVVAGCGDPDPDAASDGSPSPSPSPEPAIAACQDV